MKIEVDIDIYDYLEDIADEDLEVELASRRKKSLPVDATDRLIDAIDRDCMETALWHWQMGRTDDAIHFLERALGRKWNGLSEAALRVEA